jgi:hypothetical protein
MAPDKTVDLSVNQELKDIAATTLIAVQETYRSSTTACAELKDSI